VKHTRQNFFAGARGASYQDRYVGASDLTSQLKQFNALGVYEDEGVVVGNLIHDVVATLPDLRLVPLSFSNHRARNINCLKSLT
jgi:hypothetical protein